MFHFLTNEIQNCAMRKWEGGRGGEEEEGEKREEGEEDHDKYLGRETQPRRHLLFLLLLFHLLFLLLRHLLQLILFLLLPSPHFLIK